MFFQSSLLRRFFRATLLIRNEKPKPVILNENELEEKFILGSGKGGQKINKTSSCVQLKHIPTGIIIETQRFRELSKNRKEARKLLTLKLDELWNGELSKVAQKAKKIKKKLAKRKARAQVKYGKAEQSGDEMDSEGELDTNQSTESDQQSTIKDLGEHSKRIDSIDKKL